MSGQHTQGSSAYAQSSRTSNLPQEGTQTLIDKSGAALRYPRQVEQFFSKDLKKQREKSDEPEKFGVKSPAKQEKKKQDEKEEAAPRGRSQQVGKGVEYIDRGGVVVEPLPPLPTIMKNRLYTLRAKIAEQPVPDAYGRHHRIDRLYYINLDKNRNRRNFMEGWLSRSNIPHTRIPASVGSKDVCVQNYRGKPCIGLSGLTNSFLGIIDDHNTTGHTLILEDDFRFDVVDLQSHLQAVLDMIPNDWDLLRFECWDTKGKIFDRRVNEFVFDANWDHIRPMSNCKELTYSCGWFCGGTHSMLLRGTSAQKLRAFWGHQPYSPPDCKLSSDANKFNLTTYCVNAGIGYINNSIPGERSDIIKT